MAVRITVDIDADVRAMVDKQRQERGLSMKQVVNEAMRRGIQEFKQARRKSKPRA